MWINYNLTGNNESLSVWPMAANHIPAEAWAELEKGSIQAAVNITAAANPTLRRLEICALLGEAIAADPIPTIPVASPVPWDQFLLRLRGLNKSSEPSGTEDDEELDDDDGAVPQNLHNPFPNTEERMGLRDVAANQSHDSGVEAETAQNKKRIGGCCVIMFVGVGLFAFFPGMGLIVMGLGVLYSVYATYVATAKEESELKLAKTAEPGNPAQAQVGKWEIVRGQLKCAEPIHSVIADESLAYLHVMVNKPGAKLEVEEGEEEEEAPDLSWLTGGGGNFHAQCTFPEAWIEADDERINLVGSDYESLLLLEGDLSESNDMSEITLKNAREGRSESGVKTHRTESHTARAFLLDDGLHVADPEKIGEKFESSVKDEITVTTKCFALGDELWASGYAWEDGQGGETLGAHIFQEGSLDSNILFLTDQDWKEQFSGSESDVSVAAKRMLFVFIIAAIFMLLGALTIAFGWGPTITGWLDSLE